MIMFSRATTVATTVASARRGFDMKMPLPSIWNKGLFLRPFMVKQRLLHYSSANRPEITHNRVRRPTLASTAYARSSDPIHKHQAVLPSPSVHIRLEHGSSKALQSSLDKSNALEEKPQSADAYLEQGLEQLVNPDPLYKQVEPDPFDYGDKHLKEILNPDPLYKQMEPDPRYGGPFNFMDRHLKEEICVLRDQDYIYTVLPTFDLLARQNLGSEYLHPLSIFLKLVRWDDESKTKCDVKFEGTSCHYARLGRLACQDIRTKYRWTTDHVLLVNITTQPISLWLAYDYLGVDDDHKPRLRSLGEPPEGLWWIDRRWYQGKKTFLGSEAYEPFIDGEDDKWSIDEPLNGILGFRDTFDLAALSKDIRADWKGRVQSGLDPEKVREVMHTSRSLYGNTLRAVPLSFY